MVVEFQTAFDGTVGDPGTLGSPTAPAASGSSGT